MLNAPESKFGAKDIVAIIVAMIIFALACAVLPDQTWITESEIGLLVSRLVLALILSVTTWFISIKLLIPSDAEIIDLNVKRQIAGGIKEIKEDAAEIKSIGYKLPRKYSSDVVALGETIERIMKELANPNLDQITKIESKLYRFVNLLNKYHLYSSGQKRTTATTMAELTEIFEGCLKLTTIAMDNLELNLTMPDLSKAGALAKTLEDLYQIDGLLESKSFRETSDQVKKSISDEEK